MVNVLTKNVGSTGLSIADAVGVAIAKVVSENLISRTPAGNGNYLSGGVKVLGASVLNKVAKGNGLMAKAGNLLSVGMMVDGGEDIAVRTLGKIGLGQGSDNGVVQQGNATQDANKNSGVIRTL